MRVCVNTIDEFLAEVEECLESGQKLLENCVRVRIDRYAQQEEAVSFDVGLHATAAVCEDGQAKYLLEFSQGVGEDDGADDAGSEKAAALRSQVIERLKPRGVKVRHGKIELY